MATTSENLETRLIFTLESVEHPNDDKKTRTITIPGAIATGGDTLANTLQAFKIFRSYILTGASTNPGTFYNDVDLRQFVQPTNWRDTTGSTETETDIDTYRTIDIEIEFFSQQKTRYGVDDIPTP